MYTRVFQWCAIALNIVYSTSGNWVSQLLATLTKLLLQVTRVERSWEKSTKICKKKLHKVLKQGFSLEIHRKWQFMKTPSSKSLSTHPGVSLCCQLPSCDSYISIHGFFMLSMTALLLSESVMLLHIRIQWWQKLVQGTIRQSEIGSMYRKTHL